MKAATTSTELLANARLFLEGFSGYDTTSARCAAHCLRIAAERAQTISEGSNRELAAAIREVLGGLINDIRFLVDDDEDVAETPMNAALAALTAIGH